MIHHYQIHKSAHLFHKFAVHQPRLCRITPEIIAVILSHSDRLITDAFYKIGFFPRQKLEMAVGQPIDRDLHYLRREETLHQKTPADKQARQQDEQQNYKKNPSSGLFLHLIRNRCRRNRP